jgi:hypothetical protein
MDAAVDAGDPDEDSGTEPDAGPALNVVYASFNGTLVRIDPDTAELTEIGVLRNAANESQTYSDVVMTWSRSGDTALMITSYYQTPTLATADLCTGLVTVGAAVMRASPTNIIAEGLAVHSNGTVYIGGGNPANPVTSPISNYVGTVVLGTGAVTDLGTAVNTFQDDIDMLFFDDNDALHSVDVATTNSLLEIHSINLTTGASTLVNDVAATSSAATVLRLAYDDSRDKVFGWRQSDRNLVEINVGTGATTPLGETHASSLYGNQPSRGFFIAPAPTSCDD